MLLKLDEVSRGTKYLQFQTIHLKLKMEESPVIKEAGLGITMTAIFIAGQMAGGGVLMLPGAMVSTGVLGCVCIWYGYTGYA